MTDPTPRRVPLGQPLTRTDADLDRLSAISPQDLEEAAGWVREHAEPKSAALWEAQPDDAPQ